MGRNRPPAPVSIIPVRCTLPGYGHMTVHIRLDYNAGKKIQENFSHRKYDLSPEEWLSIMQAIVQKVEGWDIKDASGQSVPPPNRSIANTYGSLFNPSQAQELGEWILGEGFTRAVQKWKAS